jgi:hypothetical protein
MEAANSTHGLGIFGQRRKEVIVMSGSKELNRWFLHCAAVFNQQTAKSVVCL